MTIIVLYYCVFQKSTGVQFKSCVFPVVPIFSSTECLCQSHSSLTKHCLGTSSAEQPQGTDSRAQKDHFSAPLETEYSLETSGQIYQTHLESTFRSPTS